MLNIFCSNCGSKMEPVWYTDKETKITLDGTIYETGKHRNACSHLLCENCGSIEIVDDSFDTQYHY